MSELFDIEWVDAIQALERQPSASILSWLTKPYILSKAIAYVCNEFKVHVLSKGYQAVPPSEKRRLALPDDELAYVRQVCLFGDNIPFTYGRVVIPQNTFKAHAKDFEGLEDRPIGETLLYHRNDVVRSAFEYACVSPESELAKAFNLQHFEDGVSLWARRSMFTIVSHPLLITECFLPTLPPFTDDIPTR